MLTHFLYFSILEVDLMSEYCVRAGLGLPAIPGQLMKNEHAITMS